MGERGIDLNVSVFSVGYGSFRPPTWRPGRRNNDKGLAWALVKFPFLLCPEPCLDKDDTTSASLLPTAHPGARVCPQKAHSGILTQTPAHTAVLRVRSEEGTGFNSPWSQTSQIGKRPGVAQQSRANACLGGGLLWALHRLVLMILTSCVYVQEKKNQRGCLPAPISRALSLAPSLFCSLPPFANIGFKPAQNSAQRKAAAVAAAEAVASPAAETPQPQDVPPRLLDRLLRDDRPALHPRYREGVSLFLGRFADVRAEEEGRERRAQEGEREWETHVGERGRFAVCAHTHPLPRSHARRCLQHRICSPFPAMGSVSWVRELHRVVRHRCFSARYQLALTSCGPRGLRRGIETPSRKSFWTLVLGRAGQMGIFISLLIWCLSDSESVSTSLPPISLFFPLSLPVSFLSTPLPPPLPPSLPPKSCHPLPLLLYFLSTTSPPFFTLPPNGQIMPLESSLLPVSSYSSPGKREFPLAEFGNVLMGKAGNTIYLILLSTFPTLSNDLDVILALTAVTCLGKTNLQWHR